MATVGRLLADGACTRECLTALGPCASIPRRRVRRNYEALCRCVCRGVFHGAVVNLQVPGSEDWRPVPSMAIAPSLFDGRPRSDLGDAAAPARPRRRVQRRTPHAAEVAS